MFEETNEYVEYVQESTCQSSTHITFQVCTHMLRPFYAAHLQYVLSTYFAQLNSFLQQAGPAGLTESDPGQPQIPNTSKVFIEINMTFHLFFHPW
jgi:hypothetical protein